MNTGKQYKRVICANLQWYRKHSTNPDSSYRKYRRHILNWLYRQKNKLKWIRNLKPGDVVYYDLFPALKTVKEVVERSEYYEIRMTDGYIGYSAYNINFDNVHKPEEFLVDNFTK